MGGGALDVLEVGVEVEVEVDVLLEVVVVEVVLKLALELAFELPPVGEELPELLDIVIPVVGNICCIPMITFRFGYDGSCCFCFCCFCCFCFSA